MSDKQQREQQAKEQLNLTDEKFQQYKKIDYTCSVWDEIINDYSLPFNYADLAAHFKKAHLDLTDPDYVSLLKVYNEKTDSLEPLKLSFTDSETGELKTFPAEGKKMNKDIALQFVKNLDEKLKKGDMFLDLNTYLSPQKNIFAITKKESNYDFASHLPDEEYNPGKPSWAAKPSAYQSITNTLLGWYKTQVDEYEEYSRKLAENDKLTKETNHLYGLVKNHFGTENKELKQEFNKNKEEYKLYADVTQKVRKNRTEEDRLNEKIVNERNELDCIELVAGRSTKLLGRHENYKKLTELPLEQSEILPMSGLALLVSNSLDINRNIVDSSTQQVQKFVSKPGVVLTEEEQQLIKQMEISSECNNVGAKIMESFYGGSDILRMGNRGTAAVEGRIKLNEAAAEYQKGNKAPLIKLIKDSIPAVIDYAKDVKENIRTGSGQALIEIGDSLKKLFNDDPELKAAVGCPDEDLNMLYGVSAFAKKVVNPVARRAECFKKYMVPGSEDKAAYIREMVYNGFLVNKFVSQVKKTYEEAEKAAKDVVNSTAEKFYLKLDIPGLIEEKRRVNIKSGIEYKYTSDIRKWPEIYSLFEKEPVDESALIAEFDELYSNTPEYKALLDKTPDELMTMDFDSAFNKIYNAHISEAEIKESVHEFELEEPAYNKYVETVKVWDELIDEYSLSPSLYLLAKKCMESSIDVSDPAAIGLLAVYNKEKGVVESISLKGHKGEPGYPSATGFTHDKAGITEFLKELDASLKNGDQILFYNQLVKGKTIDSYVKGEKEYKYKLVNPDDLSIGNQPNAVAEPGGFKKFMHTVFGGYKKDFEKYNKYITNKADYDRRLSERKAYNELISGFAEKNWIKLVDQKNKHNAYSDYNAVVQKNKTVDEILEEAAAAEKKKTRSLELAAGRSNKLPHYHENYAKLAATPLEKIEGLQMEGLALLVGNSLKYNNTVSDGSTQKPQTFMPKPGVQLSTEEEKYRLKMEHVMGCINTTGKIFDSLYKGDDLERMGDRTKALIDSRMALNAAALEYQKGNKQPLADLLKDSLPSVIMYTRDIMSSAVSSAGQAVIEMADAVNQLFAKDEELKNLVGVPDQDLGNLYAASRLLKNIVYPQQNKLESFKKNMAPGQENKEAFVKDMLFRSYVFNTLKKQHSDILEDISLNKQFRSVLQSDQDKYSPKLSYPGASESHERDQLDEIVSYVVQDDFTTWPEIFYKFQTPEGEAELKADFEKNIVNTVEFKTLLEKNRDELGKTDFESAVKDIVRANEKRAKEAKQIIEKQKESIKEMQLKDTKVKSFEPNQDYRKPELETIEELEEPEDEPEIKPQKKVSVKTAPKLTLDDKIRISRNITERDSFVFYDGNRAERVKDTRKALYQAFYQKNRDNIKINIAKLFYISSIEQKLSNAIKEKKFDEVYAKLENAFEPEEMEKGVNDLLGSKEFNAYVQQMKPQEIKDIAYSKTEPAPLNQIDKTDIYAENRQDSLAPAKKSMKKFMEFTKELKANAEKEAQKNVSKTNVKEEKALGNIFSGN